MTHQFNCLSMPVAIIMTEDVFQTPIVELIHASLRTVLWSDDSHIINLGNKWIKWKCACIFHLVVAFLLDQRLSLTYCIFCILCFRLSPWLCSDTGIMVQVVQWLIIFFSETDISITNAQCPSLHVEANWHKTIWCRKKGTYPPLVIRRWIWHMWWKSLYKWMRLETLGERCHVENSWDTHHAITNVFPAHPSCMHVVRLWNDFYFWVRPLTCTGACKHPEENCCSQLSFHFLQRSKSDSYFECSEVWTFSPKP